MAGTSSASVYGSAPKTSDVTVAGASEMLIPMFAGQHALPEVQVLLPQRHVEAERLRRTYL